MPGRPASLLFLTSLTLALSGAAIAAVTTWALYLFVLVPIDINSADDEAALLVLAAQTWVELPPEARPYFELELAESHDLIVSTAGRDLPELGDPPEYLERVARSLAARVGHPVRMLLGDELVWAEIPMGGTVLLVGVDPDRRDTEPLYVALLMTGVGALIVLITSLVVVRRLTRPLVSLARTAERFRGDSTEALPETGPVELVALTRSFNTMAREIAELLENRTTLLAGVSHDLRTPIARMRLVIELLPEDVDRSLIARLERNLESMDQLIGEALQFARGLAGGHQTTIHPRAWLVELVQAIDPEVRFEWSGPGEVAIAVVGDALQRVLTNLLVNARQHTDGEVTLRALWRRGDGGDGVGSLRIEVLDRGPGIPEGLREKVFQPFFRLDASRSRVTGGSGLGLAIVHQLCQAHGWSIAVDERPGGGARFTLDVRCAERLAERHADVR